MDRIGQNFTLAEVARSQAAARNGIDQTPLISPAIKAAAVALAERVLDPVRVHYAQPVIVSSWYRSPLVNRIVGGSASSQHLTGEACDFTVLGVHVDDLFNFIAFESALPFDQIIHEFGAWIHLSYRRGGKNRGERLRAYKQKVGNRLVTKYEQVTSPLG